MENGYPITPEDFEELRRQKMMAEQMRQQQPAQGGGMNPGMAMQFMPEAGGASGSASGGSGGGASGASGGMGAAAPWVGLAAVIAANETWANKEGRRPGDFGNHMEDLASGKVLEYDAEALSKKMPGKSGEFLEFGAEMGNPKGAYKNVVKSLKPWEWF
jgi:hypothetical protein